MIYTLSLPHFCPIFRFCSIWTGSPCDGNGYASPSSAANTSDDHAPTNLVLRRLLSEARYNRVGRVKFGPRKRRGWHLLSIFHRCLPLLIARWASDG